MLQKEDSSTARKNYRPGSWLLVLGIILIASNLRAPITSVGPVVRNIRQDTGLSNTLTGLLTTLPLLAFALISPFAPRLARRFGMEKTLLGGMAVLATGILLRAIPFEIALFGGTTLVGMGIAIGNVLLPGFVKREFPRQAGIMTGVFIVCMGVGRDHQPGSEFLCPARPPHPPDRRTLRDGPIGRLYDGGSRLDPVWFHPRSDRRLDYSFNPAYGLYGAFLAGGTAGGQSRLC